MKKRVLPLLTALCLLLGALAVPAGAEVAQPPEEAAEAIEAVETDKVDGEETEAAEGEKTAGEEEAEAEGETAEAETAEEEKTTEEEAAEEDEEAVPLAYVSEQGVYIDNNEVPYGFYMYALYNEKGYVTYYIRARELANALWETPAAFGVSWNGQVCLTRGGQSDYRSVELGPGMLVGAQKYAALTEPTQVNGVMVELEGIRITDVNGGGYTYYKLRDLGKALDFNVGWSKARGVYIETDKPYDPSN